jgi:hypothetical protein
MVKQWIFFSWIKRDGSKKKHKQTKNKNSRRGKIRNKIKILSSLFKLTKINCSESTNYLIGLMMHMFELVTIHLCEESHCNYIVTFNVNLSEISKDNTLETLFNRPKLHLSHRTRLKRIRNNKHDHGYTPILHRLPCLNHMLEYHPELIFNKPS